jgi:hypothetical protein
VIFKEIAEGAGSCAATLAMIARDSNTSKSTTRNAIAQAVAIGLLKKTERRSYCAISLPNILSYGQMLSPAPDVFVRTTALRVEQRILHPYQGRSGNKNPLRPAGLSSMETDRAARPAALSRPCVKTHTSAKCRKHNSPARHRTSRVQHDLTLRDAITRRYFYVRRDRWSFRTAKVICIREFECVRLHAPQCCTSRCGRFIYCDAAAPSAADCCKEFKQYCVRDAWPMTPARR